MICAAKRGSQLSNGLSSAIRTLVLFFSGNPENSALSFHFSHSHFHTTLGHVIAQVVPVESLPLPHMLETLHLEVRSCSVHNTSLPSDHTCCLDKSELEMCLRFPVSRSRNRKLQSELSFLFPLPPTVQLDGVHQHLNLRHKLHTNYCKQHVLNLHVLVSLCSWESSDSLLLWELLLPRVLHLLRFFPISTSLRDSPTWFVVITNWCKISIQNTRRTYERTALPYSFPDC